MAEMIHTKESALLMLRVRNLLWEELGIRVRLSEEGVLERFIELGERSQNPEVRRTVESLCAMLASEDAPSVMTHEGGTGAGARLYRGVQMRKSGALGTKAHELGAEPPLKGRVITYRGQKMVV